ncbi:MAG: tetratricopeptide repeat protein [Acidobacteriota bacterium]
MRYRSATVLGLALLFLISCSGIKRIPKVKVPADKVVQSYRLVAEGDKLLEEHKDHLALLKYLEAADLNPYHEVIFNKLAITYSKLVQYPQARKAVERALGLDPKYAFAHNTLGIVELAEQDPKGAARAFHTAIDLKPNVASFYVNLGHGYMQSHKFKEGRNAYRKALEIDPNVFTDTETMELSFPEQTKPDPERPYQMAIFFADAGDKANCLHYLTKAFAAGFNDGKRLATEKAFDKIRQDEDFIRLLDSYGVKMTAVSR